MALRFVAFEKYKEFLPQVYSAIGNNDLAINSTFITFNAGLLAGITEAVFVVTPADVCKIRMQAQYHSMMDPEQMKQRKYGNVYQTMIVIMKEEGIRALWSGVVPTMLRQGCNQAVSFTTYQQSKKKWQEFSGVKELASWQHLLLGALSGGMGPTVNNPLDVVKTRMQRQILVPGQTPQYNGILSSCRRIIEEEGIVALWKGLTPRLMRIMPGQAITFTTYEFVSKKLSQRFH